MNLEKQLNKKSVTDKETQITPLEDKFLSENLELIGESDEQVSIKTQTTLLKTERSKIEISNRAKSKNENEQSASQMTSNRTLKFKEEQEEIIW